MVLWSCGPVVLWSCGPVGKAKGGTGENKVLGLGKGRDEFARGEVARKSRSKPRKLAPCSSGP
ncbi:hypothetical protein BOO35_18365 [Vibrio navarrensis]|nr:hypothetical protein [Vibrio navarrensis]